MKSFIIAGALALLSVSAFAQGARTIRIGVEASYAPFESKLPNGQLVGFEIDLGNALCAQIGAKCVWVENSFDGLIPALKAKKFECVMSAISITPEREKEIIFTNKTSNTPCYLVVKKGAGLHATAQSLAGKTVGVAQGSIFEIFAKKFWEPKGVTVTTYQSSDLAYADLLAGRLDGVIDDVEVLVGSFLTKPGGQNYELAQPKVYDAKIFGPGAGIGLRKDEGKLRDELNKALVKIRKNGTYDKIAKKYFNFDVYGD